MELGQIICFRTYCSKEIQGEIKDEKETMISVIKINSLEYKRKKKDF